LTPFSHFNGDFQIDNSFAPIKVRRNVYARRSTSQFQIDHWEADDVALVRLDSSVDSLEEDKLKLRDTKITVEVEALSDGTYNRKVKYEALA
jgi:YbbR domain-containing protein